MLTKCAKLTSCEEPGNKKFILYHAKACDGDEIFSYLGTGAERLTDDACSENHLVQVDYDLSDCTKSDFCYNNDRDCLKEDLSDDDYYCKKWKYDCLKDNYCYVKNMEFATDGQCAADCEVF